MMRRTLRTPWTTFLNLLLLGLGTVSADDYDDDYDDDSDLAKRKEFLSQPPYIILIVLFVCILIALWFVSDLPPHGSKSKGKKDSPKKGKKDNPKK